MKYAEEIKNLIIPPDINSAIGKDLVSRIDSLFTRVLFDFAKIKAEYKELQKLEKLFLKQTKFDAKKDLRSAEDREDFAWKQYRESELWKQVLDKEEEYFYYESLIDILKMKRDELILDSAWMKLESQL